MRKGLAIAAVAVLVAALPALAVAPASAEDSVTSTVAPPAAGALGVSVLAGGVAAGVAPGPEVAAGSVVEWSYEVVNTGGVSLWALYVWHEGVGRADCPDRFLSPGGTVRCTASSTAVAGSFSRVVSARAWDAAGVEAAVTADTFYTGSSVVAPPAAGALGVSVLAGGVAAGVAPGPEVAAGSVVEWSYEVVNTGGVSLWALYVWHEGVGRADCPDRFLSPGGTVRCTASSTAVAGSFSRVVSARAWDAAGVEAAVTADTYYTGSSVVAPPAPALDLETLVAGEDADLPPGPVVAPGSAIEIRYVVRNTGNVDLWGLWVRDGALGTITCPTRYLRPGDTVTCVVTHTAMAGRFTSSAEARAWDAVGGSVSDSDAHHYVGATGNPAIEIKALVEGYDGDRPPGPRVGRPGETILFTYVVANTGGLPLSEVRVTDDRLGPVNCPGDTLAVGETMICNATTVARLGEFASAGRVTAESALGPVAASDPVYYHVRNEPRLHGLVLEVSVNGRDADDPASGPRIPVGSSARFAYLITYTGNNIIYNVTIQDPFVPASRISCNRSSRTLSTTTRTLSCTATVRAVAGPYASLVTVVSWDANGTRVSAQDWVHYYGMA